MTRLRRLHKIVLFGLLLLVAGGFALFGFARYYLTSQQVVRRIEQRMSDILGGPVVVAHADIGLTSRSTLAGFKAYQDQGIDRDKPWIAADRVEADISALGLLRGLTPHEITLQGLNLTLPFDKDNHLLTHLPKPHELPAEEMPEVGIDDGHLTLEQEGHPPLIVNGIRMDLAGGGPGLNLKGSIDDPYWGKWTLAASLDAATKQITLQLDTGPTHLDMQKLRSLPFVPKAVWDEVEVEGDTPVHLVLTYQPPDEPDAKPKVHYRIELEPYNTNVYVSAIKLRADHASGKVVIEDKVVYLKDVKGLTADGKIMTDAVLDFRQVASKLDFKIAVEDLALRKLPRSWKVPSGIDGRLTGHADLHVVVLKGKAISTGSGEGEIQNARLGQFHIKKPIKLTLHADQNGFRFRQHRPDSGTPAAALGVLGMVALVAPPPQAEPELEGPLSWAANIPDAVGRGVSLLTRKATDAVSAGLSRLSGRRNAPPKPSPSSTNYVEADLSLEDVNLAELVSGLKIHLPFTLQGTLSIQMRVGVPIDTPGELKAYRLEGKATLPRLVLAGRELTGVKARIRFNEGVLDIFDLNGRLPAPGAGLAAGSFYGSARLEVRPLGNFTADLRIIDMPLDNVLALLPAKPGDAEGRLSGNVSARAPADRLRDLAAWDGKANLQSQRLRVYGQTLTDFDAPLALSRGQAKLADLHGNLNAAPITATAQLGLTAPYPTTAHVNLAGVDLAGLGQLAPDFRPPLALSGNAQLSADLKGTLSPMTLQAKGSARVRELGVDGLKMDDLSFDWAHEPNEWMLRSIKARLYGGEVTGNAVIPVNPGARGKVELHLHHVDAQAFSKALPAVPVRLEGKVSGAVNARLTLVGPGKSLAVTSDIELAAPRLRVQGIPTEQVKATVDYQPVGEAKYHLEGESLGGRFKLDGKLPVRGATEGEEGSIRPVQNAPQQRPQPPPDGRLQVEGIQLNRLWRVYGLQETLGALCGMVSFDLAFRHVGPERRPIGQGRFRATDLRWGNEELSSGLQGEIRLREEGLEFRDVTGSIGQGILRANFLAPLGERTSGWFNVVLIGVDAGHLVLPWKSLSGRIQGPVDANLRGRLGAEWYGGGTVVLTRGRVFGLEVSEWHVPVQFAFAPRQGSGELTVSDSNAAIAEGRALGRAAFAFGSGARVEGNMRFYDVNIRTLLASAGEVGSFASGRLSGRFDLAGSEVHSVDDLTGTLSASLNQTQAMQLPVLRQITPFLRLGTSSTTFQTGQIQARLGRGIMRIQRFSLESSLVNVFIEGTVSLDGRLNLDVNARTGDVTLLPAGLRILGLRLPIAGPIPLSLITEASYLLARSVVHLRVTGSVRNPVVQIEPLALLTQEAVRYFLLRAVVPIP
jgi:hypothetical protein